MTLSFTSQLNIDNVYLHQLTLHPEKFYRKSTRPKMKFGRKQINKDGSDKMRTTYEPCPDLKYKQRLIKQRIEQIKLPQCMFGGISGLNNIINAEQHVANSFFLTVDLKDFFSNITHKQVYNALIENHFADKEAKKITRLTTLNGSLPQGAVTSTALANLVFSSTAIEIQAFCVKKSIIFTAFIDDLTFSSNKNFEFYKNDLLQFIKQNGFRLNHKKIKYRRNSCEVTGLIIKNQMLHLEKEMLNRCWMPQIKAYANTVAKHNMIISNEKLLNFRKAAF